MWRHLLLFKRTRIIIRPIDEFYVNQWESLPVTTDTVRRCTRTDRELSQIYEYTLSGWPKSVSQHMHGKDLPDQSCIFFNRRNEMSINQGCLVWGTHVVIPKSLREQLLHEVHTGHLGIVRMKHVARSFIWWPGIDSDIENTARTCVDCKRASSMPPKTVLTAHGRKVNMPVKFKDFVTGK